MKLTEHFSLEEFTNSQTALRKSIDNTPSKKIIDNLYNTAKMMERVRSILDAPVHITSGYRSEALNRAIGGSLTSQHMTGEADDFIAPGFGSPFDIVTKLSMSTVNFDQLIYEGTWVHISFLAPREPRREVLTWSPASGYTSGITVSI